MASAETYVICFLKFKVKFVDTSVLLSKDSSPFVIQKYKKWNRSHEGALDRWVHEIPCPNGPLSELFMVKIFRP